MLHYLRLAPFGIDLPGVRGVNFVVLCLEMSIA